MMRLLSNMLSNQWNLKASQTFRNSSRNRWVGSARSENPSASFTQLSSKLLTGEHDAINWQLSPCVLSKVQFGKTKTSMQPVCGWIAPMLLLLSHVSSPQDLMAFPAFAPLGAPPYYILSHIMSSAGVILDSSSIRSPPAATAKLCARHWQRCFVRESPPTRAGSEVHSELSSLDLMLVHIRAAGQLRSRARHPLNLSKDRGFYTPWLSSLFTAKSRRKKTETPAHGWWDFVLVALFLSVFSFCVENWRTGPNITVQVLRAPTMESDQIYSSDLFCYLNSHIHSTIQPTAATRSAEMTTISRTLQHYRESKQNHNENIRVQRLHKVSGCYVRRVCFVAPSFAVIWKLLKGRGGDSSCSLTTL